MPVLGTDYQIGSTLVQNGSPYVVTAIAGNVLTLTQQSRPNPPSPPIVNLPTADPHIKGELWANSAVVTVSAG